MRNRFPGYCLNCRTHVPKGEGHPQRHRGRWLVRCLKCVRLPKRVTK